MAIVVFEHSPAAGVGRLGATLRNYGHRLRTVRLHAGEPVPPDLDDVDGVITAGGPQSPRDDHPWLDAELDFLRRTDARALPVVGLCLGCELLARALGGEVGPLEDGPEVGWHDVTLTASGAEDPIFAGIAWTSTQLHWHGEHVTKPPPAARVLAKSRRCPIQAWARGLRTYAFQYHPEADEQAIERWAAEDPELLKKAGATLEDLREQTARHYAVFARLSERLFESIALFLVPADHRIPGVARDLHH